MTKLCVFKQNDTRKIGIKNGDKIAIVGDLQNELGVAGFDDLEKAIAAPPIGEVALKDVELLAPVPFPPRVFGIGLNYSDHAAETGRPVPSVQTWFMKQHTAINSPYGDVQKPVVSDLLDYEVEIVVIIGKKCRHVPATRANEVILGYCVGNDVSVRDWQMATPTMIMGKGFDTTAPIGPWVITPDEIGDISKLRLRAILNGQIMQDGCVGDMVFGVPQMIEHLSTAMTLLPGDVIFTGTPAGVGVARKPPVFMKAGDTIRCEIDGIGFIESKIVDEVKKTVI
jgi:2-keto-4-pentenoate hydratase/2-oxohepta-3-ene-1,7-dioic acid hydratase in catechol pathway